MLFTFLEEASLSTIGKYPSIMSTCGRTAELYLETYLQALPFSLCMAIMHYFYSRAQISDIAIIFFSIIYGCITCLLFTIVLYGMYQKYHQQSFKYLQAIRIGITQTPQVILAVFILFTPFLALVLMSLLMSGGGRISAGSVNFSGGIVAFLFLALAITLVLYALAFPRIVLSFVVISANNVKAMEGVKQSWELSRGYWWITFLLFILFYLVYLSIYKVLSMLYGDLTTEVMIVIGFSLVISLMIVHCDNLERISKKV